MCASRKSLNDVSSMLWKNDVPLFPRRKVMFAHNLARPRPAAPPGFSTRPAAVCPGFVYDRFRRDGGLFFPGRIILLACNLARLH